jgi:hypothetical protein
MKLQIADCRLRIGRDARQGGSTAGLADLQSSIGNLQYRGNHETVR